MKKVIAIVGMPGAGKSIAGIFFKEKNIPVLRFGDITDENLLKRGLSLTQENEQPFREKLRQELGMAAFAMKMEPKIRAALKGADIVVLDGLRSFEEYEYLQKRNISLSLLAIYASPLIRYQRLSHRLERPLAKEEARKRDIAELNLHIGSPIAIADYLIKNETTREYLRQELEKFLKEITNDYY